MKHLQKFLIMMWIIMGGGLMNTALATENGAQHYPIGVNTVVPAIAPPPGQTVWQNYMAYYSAGSFKDDKGNSSVPGFELNVAVEALRGYHSWEGKIGPFGMSSAIVLPFVKADVKTAFGGSDDFALSDITLQPLYLTYNNSSHTFFALAGVDFFIPTNTKTSRKYAAAVPTAAMTWFPKKGTDLNLEATLEFALEENEDTNYKSGDLFMLEVSGHVSPFASLPNLSVGFNGYMLKQFSSDKVAGVDIGFEGQTFAIGPEITYKIGKGGGIAVKWQHEFNVENRPQGNKFWLQFQVPLGM